MAKERAGCITVIASTSAISTAIRPPPASSGSRRCAGISRPGKCPFVMPFWPVLPFSHYMGMIRNVKEIPSSHPPPRLPLLRMSSETPSVSRDVCGLPPSDPLFLSITHLRPATFQITHLQPVNCLPIHVSCFLSRTYPRCANPIDIIAGGFRTFAPRSFSKDDPELPWKSR
jgi:hypothetical protein